MAEASIAQRARFDFIRYASVWEDADILCEALAPAAKGGRVLSIASAGDNALALLTLDPAEVVAVDLNPAQLACVELRIAAFRRLSDADVLRFLGAEPCPDRQALYADLRSDLSDPAAAFWDARPELVRRGVIHVGRFEAYMHGFGRWVLPLIHSRRTIRALLEPRSREERAAFYAKRWDTWRWRALFRLFFGRTLLARGRDPAFLTHVEGPTTERFLARTRQALVDIPAATNPYLSYILQGAFPAAARPRYLQPEWMPIIRERLDRLKLARGRIEEPEGPFDAYNLSDIFEYMSPAEHETCYAALLAKARPGARLAYWNMLVPRSCPSGLLGQVEPLVEEARELHARDRAFFYSAFHLDQRLQ